MSGSAARGPAWLEPAEDAAEVTSPTRSRRARWRPASVAAARRRARACRPFVAAPGLGEAVEEEDDVRVPFRVPLVHDQLPAPGACPPVHRPQPVAGRECACPRTRGRPRGSRDEVAGRKLGLERGDEALQELGPWVDWIRCGRRIGLPTRASRPVHAPAAECRRARRPPPLAAEGERSVRSSSAGSRSCEGSRPRRGRARRGGEVQLEQVDRRRGVDSITAASSSPSSAGRDRAGARRAPRAAPRRSGRPRRGTRMGLRRRRAPPGASRARRPGRPPRARGTARAGAMRRASWRWRGAPTSSAGGVGTASSVSRTTSSPDRRCTQSSGFSRSRWASAGTATALTSSGMT